MELGSAALQVALLGPLAWGPSPAALLTPSPDSGGRRRVMGKGQSGARAKAMANRCGPLALREVAARSLTSRVEAGGHDSHTVPAVSVRSSTMTGKRPFHSSHGPGSQASSHRKCATLAMRDLSGLNRLLTRAGWSV